MDGLEISPFVKGLPKVELHVHIEGTLTPALRWKLAHQNNVKLPYATYEELLDSYAVTYNHRKEVNGDDGRPTFLEAYFAGCQVLVTEDDFYELSMEYFSRCVEMNVRYCEPFFDTQAHTERGISVPTILNGYLRAQKDGLEKYGVRSNWIFCFLRDRPLREGLDAYAAARSWGRLADGTGKGLFHAVGLAANEFEKPPMLFEAGFRMAKEDGLHVTLHCDVDQKDAADHVRQAIFEVCDGQGTERIDHGLNALDRPDLVPALKQRGIGLTLCPHAYHRRQSTETLFPKITSLIRAGVKLCINSDDPTYMHNVWIDGNMQKVYTYCGLSKAEMVTLVKNGIEMSWADEKIKMGLMEELDRLDVG
ncbi:putative adenosine deaminase [Paraphaeosphaeria sporulosa]|uniref:Putative adenosine deaminase n=1 Tax=Paraphaeosphaeria sporulosa TaxID=1460663 RepID=A0A177CKY1_9PLEO|nr:putative adenosine deaminase [Paraphaeosphaeria sporulosa]OAG07510.1 putative adenosine deaminase [Paraphaeosphaeria sporulosa]